MSDNKDNDGLVLAGGALLGYLLAGSEAENISRKVNEHVDVQIENVRATMANMYQVANERLTEIEDKFNTGWNVDTYVEILKFTAVFDAINGTNMDARIWLKVKNKATFPIQLTYTKLVFTIAGVRSLELKACPATMATTLNPGVEQWWCMYWFDNFRMFNNADALRSAVGKKPYGNKYEASLEVVLDGTTQAAAVPVSVSKYNISGTVCFDKYLGSKNDGFQILKNYKLI